MLRRIVRGVRRGAVETVKRGYAVGLILIIVWLSWRALRYLLLSLVLTPGPPAQVVDLPTLGPGAFERGAREFGAARATRRPRLPPGHYHRFGSWFQPDQFNDCARSGCHAPLPHNRHKESRAFLNMHATSLHCGVCHMQAPGEPLRLTWYDLQSGAACAPPAVLRAHAWLHEPRSLSGQNLTRADQRRIVELLRQAAQEAGGDPALLGLSERLAAVRVASADFRRLLDLSRETVPEHFRGEYGAKLALLDPQTDQPMLAHPQSAAAAREYIENGDALAGAEREKLLSRVHTRRREQTRNCTDCHARHDSVIDLASAGYPDARIEALVRPLVMQAVEHIMRGQPLYLPGFVSPDAQNSPPSDGAADDDQP
jgi:hypothetical protein